MAEDGLGFTQDTVMSVTLQLFDAADRDQHTAALRRVDAAREDEYWRWTFDGESYYRQGLDYEDYAPAYCVGYIGYSQYGGAYEDAEASLCANWQRIRGDSRLALDDARRAMRAAWNRMAGRAELRAVRLVRPRPDRAAPTMRVAPG
jgi:hypothetical protein